MKKTLILFGVFSLLFVLSGCDNEAEIQEKKKKRENFIKHVDTNGSNAPTKLPL